MSRMVTAPGCAREYETIYILRPDIDADAAERVSGRVNEAVSKDGGKFTKVELWGRRRLSYDIKKNKRGVYVYVKYVGDGKIVTELERNLRLSDDVLKFQTVLLNNSVEGASVAVNEDEVKFERLEMAAQDDDHNDSRERQLGLVEHERPSRVVEDEAEPADDDSAETASTDDEET